MRGTDLDQKLESGCGSNVWNIMCRKFTLHKIHLSFSSYYSFLSSGDSYSGLAAHYRLGKSTVHKIISQTCKALWIKLQPEVMPKPTERNWQKIKEGFRKRWHFPNCIGALDGKHISIRSPPSQEVSSSTIKAIFALFYLLWWMQITGLFLLTLENMVQIVTVMSFNSPTLGKNT